MIATPLVEGFKSISCEDNVLLKAPIREGKTFTVCNKIAECNNKVLYITRTHQQAKEVTEHLVGLGVPTAHVAGRNYREFRYLKERGGYDPWSLYNSMCRRKNIVKEASNLLINDIIQVVVTVPELAIHFAPSIFDCLVMDEERTLEWFKPESQLLFTFSHAFGRFEQESNIERAIELLKDRFTGKVSKQWIKWAETIDTLIKFLPRYKDEAKRGGSDTPEKDAVERLNKELLNIPNAKLWLRPIPKNDENIIRVMEKMKKKAKNEELSSALNLVANSFNFLGFEAFTTQDGGRVWGISDTKKFLLFKDWFNQFGVIWVVLNKTSKTGGWFFNKLVREYKIVEKQEFRFEEWFINTMTKEPNKVAMGLFGRNIPTAHVVGRKKDAYKLRDTLRDYGIHCVVAEEHTKEEIESLVMDGYHIILYLNSKVSKGIDLPIFEVMMIHNYKFAVPSVDKGVVEAMRDELEQVILRCCPIDEDDPRPRLIVWKHQEKRDKKEQEFVKHWLKENGYQQSQKDNKLFKSNFLPLVNVPTLPVTINKDTIWQKKSPVFYFTETKKDSISWSEARSLIRNKNPPKAIITETHHLKPPENSSLLFTSIIKNLEDEQATGRFFKVDSSAIESLWDNLRAKKLRSDDVTDKFKQAGIKRKQTISEVLKAMMKMELLTKEKQGRNVYYLFSDTDDFKEPVKSGKVEIKRVKPRMLTNEQKNHIMMSHQKYDPHEIIKEAEKPIVIPLKVVGHG